METHCDDFEQDINGDVARLRIVWESSRTVYCPELTYLLYIPIACRYSAASLPEAGMACSLANAAWLIYGVEKQPS